MFVVMDIVYITVCVLVTRPCKFVKTQLYIKI